jgi:hypothetical protein
LPGALYRVKEKKPAKSDEVKIYIKASSNSTVLIVDLKTLKSSQALMGRAFQSCGAQTL